NLTGQGTQPEIAVSQGSSSLVDGVSIVKFGRVNVGSSSQRTFTIRNAGTGTLTGLAAGVSGGAFVAGSLPATTLVPGGTMSLIVTFTPGGAFDSFGSLRIFSNDVDESPFDINLTGTGNVPWLEVEQPAGTSLVSEFSVIDFGTGAQGESATLTFAIRNVGTSALTGLTVAKNGTDAADFAVTPPAVNSIAPDTTTTFTVTFTASSPGERTAAVLVSSNETFSNTPFTVNLKGTSSGLGDTSDPDGDGIPSLVESATGTDPLVSNPPPGVLTKNGDILEYTFTRPKSVIATMSFTLDYSDTLEGPWSSLGANDLTLVSEDDVSQVVKFALLAGEAGRRFVRLRVTRL
ncbi:MAG TPA: choice-of-anchor D domain-containing protein, partial [Verrucomicrobiales bacterium]|nr:choice-of-anchor D domain-containing protein [Verrucomicrobiales bacterium]